MAKRKKLTAPSAAEMSQLEAGFAAKPSASASGVMPPIAQVAAEAAALAPVADPAAREAAARDSADAERLRSAEVEGRLVQQVPTAEIVAEELTRDRTGMEPEALEELKNSLLLSGMRMPLELFELSKPDEGGRRYGLLSGYRRLAAARALEAESGDARWSAVPALIREPGSVANAYLAMVEENEIRADLTPYERGRVAVIATAQGAYPTVEAAVNGLFHAASKAKRSKIRSFALVHEELGDLLSFPEALSERAGLRLAGALRAGFAAKLREALDSGQGVDSEAEWQLMEPAAQAAEAKTRAPSKGGRPRKQAPPDTTVDTVRQLDSGITLRRMSDAKGHFVRIEGRRVDSEMMEHVLDELARCLGAS